MRPLAPHLEEPTANDDGKIPSLVAEPSVNRNANEIEDQC